MSRDRTSTITDSNLPAAVDTAVRAGGRDPFTYRWVLLVEGIELDERFLTAIDSNHTDHDLLYGPADLVDLFSGRLTALGGAL
jgi:hypothetical protein